MGVRDKGREFFVARRRRPVVGGIFIQSSSGIHERKVIDRCVVPTGDPEKPVCGHVFFEGESQEVIDRHVAACAREHHDAIVEHRERQHPEIMRPWDPELAAWVKKHGRAILEGRKRI